jgi:Subtilase family
VLRRLLTAGLVALIAAPALAFGTAGAAQADAVRSQELWVLNAIGVPVAWQTSKGSGVTVALIDSGVNGQVSDLAGSVTNGRNFTGVATPPSDPHWGVHGTWMASLIAGHGHAGGSSGVIGVAPEARILSIRAVTDQGDPGNRRYEHEKAAKVQRQLAAAISYAAKRRVQVISMSLGYQGASLPVRAAIAQALAKGIVVVASSGNSGHSRGSRGNAPYSFPADYPGVLGVGAVARSGAPANFSSNNLSVEVAAPGIRVPTQGRDGQYWLVSGTSPACALTAGVAALIKSRYPALRPALVVQAITGSTRNRPSGGYDEEVGFGTVDAAAALQLASRLVRDSSTGRGLATAARFGGGPTAVPPVPVAPRGTRQLLIEALLALVCLVLVVASALRLIVTRRRPADTAPAGPAEPAYGPPTGYGPSAGYGPPSGYGPSDSYGLSDSYGPSGSYGTPDSYGSPTVGYGPPVGYRAPADGYAPPAHSGPPVGYGPSAVGDRPPAGSGPRVGHGPSAVSGPAVGYGPSAGSRPAVGYEPSAVGDRPLAGSGPAAGHGPPADQDPPGATAEGQPHSAGDAWPPPDQW